MKLEAIDVSGASSVVPASGLAHSAGDVQAGPRDRRGALDIVAALIGMTLALFVAAILLVLNPFFNPGPLLFRQVRMGRGGRRFMMWKFRTMAPLTTADVRAADAPLEHHRITPLGRWLRKTRIDELPNFVNVWRGEMSVIGPRPDAWEHATIYSATVRDYAQRFRVRPGITGLAQVRGGYADTLRAVERKARFDRFYVENWSPALDLYIVGRTLWVMVSGFGAK